MHFEGSYFETMSAPVAKAFRSMEALEKGAIANPDEKRMVGHYWLRAPELAPNAEVRHDIEDTNEAIYEFVRKVDAGELQASNGDDFTDLLLIGIGGSALGPQLVADALGTDADRMRVHYLDNTDPEGISRSLDEPKRLGTECLRRPQSIRQLVWILRSMPWRSPEKAVSLTDTRPDGWPGFQCSIGSGVVPL